MPEITKSGAKLHLFIVTHKYTDLYFIFSFNNQPQVDKPTWGYDYTTVLRRLPHPIVRHHHLIAHPHRPPSSSDCPIGAIHRHRRETAEERFNMLARGWLAYPVTTTHALLPPKSGCINVIPWFASLVAERRHSSVTRYAKRSVACRDSPRHQPLRAGGTPLPHHRRLPSPIGLRIPIVRHHHHLIAPTARCENRRRAVSYVSTGLACLPRDANASSHRFAYPVTPCAIRRERSLRFPEAPLFALINYCFLTA